MRIDVVSIFPEYLSALELSLLGKARGRGLVDLHVHDLRRWTDFSCVKTDTFLRRAARLIDEDLSARDKSRRDDGRR